MLTKILIERSLQLWHGTVKNSLRQYFTSFCSCVAIPVCLVNTEATLSDTKRKRKEKKVENKKGKKD